MHVDSRCAAQDFHGVECIEAEDTIHGTTVEAEELCTVACLRPFAGQVDLHERPRERRPELGSVPLKRASTAVEILHGGTEVLRVESVSIFVHLIFCPPD